MEKSRVFWQFFLKHRNKGVEHQLEVGWYSLEFWKPPGKIDIKKRPIAAQEKGKLMLKRPAA